MERSLKHYYESLYEVAAIVNSARDPEAVLNSIVEYVAKTAGAKGCSLMLFNRNMELLIHSAFYGLSEKYVKKGPVSVDRSISETLDGKAVVIFDTTKDVRIQYPDKAAEEGIASILSAPVKREGQIIGVIRVYSGEPYHFSVNDIYFVNVIANFGAIVLHNAKQYEQIQNEYEAFRPSTF